MDREAWAPPVRVAVYAAGAQCPLPARPPAHPLLPRLLQHALSAPAAAPRALDRAAAMGNGMNKILPGLYIGNFKDARDAEQLSKNKVTHIPSVHDSARPTLEGVKYLCIPAADSPYQNLTRHFKESIKFIHECSLQGEGCLVHCLAGVSRSVTLVVAYIMTVTDFGWEDACALCVRGGPVQTPTWASRGSSRSLTSTRSISSASG